MLQEGAQILLAWLVFFIFTTMDSRARDPLEIEVWAMKSPHAWTSWMILLFLLLNGEGRERRERERSGQEGEREQ